MNCNICNSDDTEIIYKSSNGSMSTKCELDEKEINIYCCNNCLHIFTIFELNLIKYYDEDYNIDLNTEEEDQLYSVVNGKNVYRSDFQYELFKKEFNYNKNSKILDYGCAKSTTMKKIAKETGIQPYLFDVSNNYKEYWLKFTTEERCSVYNTPKQWNSTFDIVTSFFALEHVKEPKKFLQDIHKLLKENGSFYFIVPNTLVNIADFVVNDHINHFTKLSLEFLLKNNGFEIEKIDTESYFGAILIHAKKNKNHIAIETRMQKSLMKKEIVALANYWNEYEDNISKIKDELKNESFAIYGSGFYGSLVYQKLSSLEHNLVCFLDQSPHRQKHTLFKKDIISPMDISSSINHIVVGLNPSIAKKALSNYELETQTIHYLKEL